MKLNEKIINTDLTRGEKQRLQTCVLHLSGIQVQFERCLQRGAGLQSEQTEARVEWRDVQSAFQNRIRTGIVVNINHIDIFSFLNDAQELFKTHAQACLEEYSAIKVNSDFVAEFSIQGIMTN